MVADLTLGVVWASRWGKLLESITFHVRPKGYDLERFRKFIKGGIEIWELGLAMWSGKRTDKYVRQWAWNCFRRWLWETHDDNIPNCRLGNEKINRNGLRSDLLEGHKTRFPDGIKYNAKQCENENSKNEEHCKYPTGDNHPPRLASKKVSVSEKCPHRTNFSHRLWTYEMWCFHIALPVRTYIPLVQSGSKAPSSVL